MRHRPLLILGLGFIAGIGAWLGGIHALAAVLTVAVVGLVLLMVGGRRWQQSAVGIALTGLAAGALWTAHFQVVAASDVSHWTGGVAPVHLTGTIVTDPDERHGRVTFLVQTTRIQTARQAADVTGAVYVALNPTAAAVMSFDYGDKVALDGHLETPPDATNPGAFSWRDYLARRGVYCQLRVKRTDAVQKLGASALNPYMRLAWAVRRRVLGVVSSSLPPVPAAVLSGILLGKRSDLPRT